MGEKLTGMLHLVLGDCRDFLANMSSDAIIVTDPPYGIGYRVNGRGKRGRLLEYATAAKEAFHGGDEQVDIEPLLRFRKVAIFGANHYSLPQGGRWIVWDKRRDSAPDDHPDCELIWTNVPGADRIHRQKWRGIVREGEENVSRSPKLHPNQKPVALLDMVFDLIGIEVGDLVVDPYMGSGSTGVVAIRRGLQFIGIERDPAHFATASRRLEAEIAGRQALDQNGGEHGG